MNLDPLTHIDSSMSELTDFQRATVAATDARIQASNGQGARILIADEVGLGKTLVARGVLALTLRRWLQSGPKNRPLRVVYVCSNQALAHENAVKLAVFRDDASKERWMATPTFGRLSDLGIKQDVPQPGIVLELCSLTPATSFALTSGDGTARERYIIWKAVSKDRYVEETPKIKEFFRNGVGPSWTNAEDVLGTKELEVCSLRDFHQRLSERPDLSTNHKKSVDTLGLNDHSWRTLLRSASELKKKDVGSVTWLRSRIREIFVECCTQNLKADLFILDEFQRFRDLITVAEVGDVDAECQETKRSEQQVIAQKLLHQQGPYNTLLLSATPFKALSHVKDDEEGKAHAQELNQLMRYLANNSLAVVNSFKDSRQELLSLILDLPDSPLQANSLDSRAKHRVEEILRAFICRTERGQLLPDNHNVLHNVQAGLESVSPAEINSFVSLDQLTEALKKAVKGSVGNDIMQFFKAAPWCLSFIKGYQLHESLKKYRREPEVARALKAIRDGWIPSDAFDRYQMDISTSAPSARLRQLVEVAIPHNAERMLWMPASLPAYRNDGPFAGNEGFSKTLLFSALVLAPRALSGLVSYEAERRLLTTRGKRGRYFGDRKEESGTFRFDAKSISPAWSLVYPGSRLIDACDQSPSGTLADVRAKVRKNLEVDFKLMVRRNRSGNSVRGSKWYTLAPFLLDKETGKHAHVGLWMDVVSVSKEIGDVRRGQVSNIKQALQADPLDLGEPPADLLDYLVDLAIAGPGICLYRALEKVWPGTMGEISATVSARSKVADAPLVQCAEAALHFVNKMNRIESQRVLRAVCPIAKPWVAVARYAAMGNLQSVFDEYAHLLKCSHSDVNHAIAALKTALAVSAVTVSAQTRLPFSKATKHDEVRFHCHYAVALGNQKSSDEQSIHRITNVRAAFNSPFWPFMLNSTSIGQEGLDFHWYCRRVVHWSLPSNPIDLEQREGRVNRYKSLVVRQRAAELFLQKNRMPAAGDIWVGVFDVAKRSHAGTDLVPYWHVPGGSAQIERIVPSMLFSTETVRLDEILRILSLYRLAFGQPRQQELVGNLLKRNFTDSDLEEIKRALLIDLAPVSYMAQG